ncbi:hypothetical protein [Lysinibacillus sp. 38-6]|uniref:hypothetical protein n=1 Tax=Lysinibacillus sp. 38-6 TaxID=3385991 RepID=UPI00390890DA
MEMRDWFSIPMILSSFVMWILTIFIQIALELNLIWLIFNPINFLAIAYLITGVVYQIRQTY